MHIFVNGVEQPVMVTSGSQNPTGNIKTGTELYFGADYSGYIDETKILNTSAAPTGQPMWLQWWFLTAIAGAIVACSAGGVLYLRNKKRRQ
jgi:hypothetical protein